MFLFNFKIKAVFIYNLTFLHEFTGLVLEEFKAFFEM